MTREGGGGRVRGGGKGEDVEWEPIEEHLILKNVFSLPLLLLLSFTPDLCLQIVFCGTSIVFYSIFILIPSPDYTDLAMSTVKQTQAIPYTGPFNLLYYQLQKLTGVYLLTFTQLFSIFCMSIYLGQDVNFGNCVRIAQILFVLRLVMLSPLGEILKID